MAELPTITPPPSAQQVQAPSQSNATQQPSTALTSLPTGSTIQGFVINRDATGNPIVRTPQGDVPFATNFYLKIGSEVVIRIGSIAGVPTANLVSVDGKTPEVAQAASAFSQDPEVIISPHTQAAATQAPATAAPITDEVAQTLTIIKGTIIAPPQTTTAQGTTEQPAVFTNGTQLSLRIVNITNPTGTAPQTAPDIAASTTTTTSQATSAFYATYARAAGTPSNTPQSPTTAATTTPQTITTEQSAPPTTQTPTTTQIATPTTPSKTPTTQTIVTPLPLLLTPSNDGARVTSAAPVIHEDIPEITAHTTETEDPTSTIPRPGTSIPATVVSREASGESIIQTPVGVVRLQTEASLPSGSNITFELLDSTPPEQLNIASAFLANSQPAPITELAQQWNGLQQIFSLLTGRGTQTGLDDLLQLPGVPNAAAQTQPNNLTPQSITTGMLVFMTALKSGDFTNWLGASNIKLLRDQGHGDLLKKVSSEFAAIAKQFNQPVPGHWQPLFFPLPVDGIMQQVRIFVKKDRKENKRDDQPTEEDTRFIIEVDLTYLGELQLDGFVRKQEKYLHFDMIIRSLAGLSPDMQHDILGIYNNMGQITGYKGTLTFQAVREFPVNPMVDLVATHDTFMA